MLASFTFAPLSGHAATFAKRICLNENNSGHLSSRCTTFFVLQDWGFFVPYLIGSISLIVLAVGSISPG